MTTLRGLVTIPGVGTFPDAIIAVTPAGRANGKTSATPIDIGSLVASIAAVGGLAKLGPPNTIIAALEAWTNQDDDAHEPCSLTACRHPLHPGPCKGWKGTLHAVSPHIYRQMEEERVRKANHRRLQRIADLKAQNKPIPRKLLEEIKPKPAPVAAHPAHGAAPVPLGQVGQKADLAGGQAHTAGQAVSNAAGIKPSVPLPLGPKQKKPSVSGRGPAFVITQPKVTDQYKLDKAAKITDQEWAGLSGADKKAIRDELEAIKIRGFGPQQKKADELLAKLPAGTTMKGTLAPGTPGTITTPKGNVHQVINLPGKTTLGQATKAIPPAVPSTPAAPQAPVSGGKKIFSVVHNGVTTTRTSSHPYTHASVVRWSNGTETVASFHTSEAAALKGVLTGDQKKYGAQVIKALPVKVEDVPRKGGKLGAPQAPTAPTPPAPAPSVKKALSANAQHARAVAGRAVGGRPTAKLHLEAYGRLSKDEFDSLDGNTQRFIRDDLANAKAKFLDPKKQQAAQDLLDRFGAKHTSPAPAGHPAAAPTPAVPSHPKGYSDPVAQAVAAAHGTDDAEALKRVGQLSHQQLDTLDAADKKTITARLAFIASHPKADQATKDKARDLGRLIVTGKPSGLPKMDHEPTLNEIHAHQVKSGAAAQTRALEAADAKTAPRANRIVAMAGLTKAHFDDLNPQQQRRITDALLDLHSENSGYGKTEVPEDQVAADAVQRYTGHAPAVFRAKQAEQDYRSGKIDAQGLDSQIVHAAVQVTDFRKPGADAAKKAFEAEKQRIAEDNPSLPLWLRAKLIDNPYGSKVGSPYHVISQLSMEHSWRDAPRLSQHDFQSLFISTDADLASSHPIHAEAVKKYREHVVSTGLANGSPWSTATKSQLVNALTGTGYAAGNVVTDDHMKMFHDLSVDSQMRVRSELADRILAQTNDRAKTGTNITLRQLQGHPYTGDQLEAALAAADHFAGSDTQDKYRKLDPADFQAFPQFTQDAIVSHLDDMQQRAESNGPVRTWTAQDNALKVFPAALRDHLRGTRTQYADRRLRTASDVANYGQKIINPYDRTRVYADVPIAQFKVMPLREQQKITSDLDDIAKDTGNGLAVRYGARFTSDFTHGQGHNRINANQLVAVGATDPRPGNNQPDSNVTPALTALSKSDYDSLDKVYQDAIDERIKTIRDPMTLTALAAKFHPSTPATAAPSGMAPTTVQTNVPPHVQDALDTIYGVHPKAHTMAHQLKTYGGLRGSDFHQLNSQEQSHLLADLSFIETTAKGPSADKARKLIDRFTPAGTTPGTVPPQPIIPPANAVPGQQRYPTPLKGALVKATDSGKSGDKWIYPSNHSRVWGEYGAAGLLIKHVDPHTGEERYLMVQRGPAISDPGKWTFPGGAIDSKETPHQGAARETLEELGLKDDQLKDAVIHGDHTYSIPGHTWKYTTVAAQAPSMFQPNLSTAHARAETSDAKWMTLDEIRALDRAGKLHGPIAGGKLEQNVISLYPAAPQTLGQLVGRPGPVTKRQKRLTLPSGGRQAPAQFNAWPHAHKPSTGKHLVRDKAAIDKLRQDVKQARKAYDGKTADGRLAAIGNMQGYDDTPTVVSKKEIDRLLATGDYIEAWRGVRGSGGWSGGGKSAAEINEEFRSGPAYYGKGIFGNGYYLATQKSVADKYSDHTKNSVVRMLIPKSAITEHYKDMQKEARANASRRSQAKGGSYEDGTLYDPGRWAAAKGVDGIQINHDTVNDTGGWARHVAAPGKPAFNWLNRAVLIVQEADK